ncbi:polyamine ABC transporter substrate-binding protein [Rhodoligotrophos defluvii]|uniref:polyamine ABC transporter substrate-binding protein n=1 Tax=Rhodoligotrophos defluvii TaxID=2561934 RepID=UPI0010C99319|nr:spermidine/putrescine ABC transporter substrate-binding protein [Rhodoligotrophos defluvii]
MMMIHRARRLHGLTRRGLLTGTAAGLGLALAGPLITSRAAAQVEDQLSMMGWADYISPDNISAWESANNSRLIYDSYASNDEMYSKLQLAQGNSGYDVGMNTDFMIKLLIDKQLIQKLDKSLIPNIGNIRPEVANPNFDPGNEYTVPKSWGSQGFIYDKSVITRPMKSWSDFLEAVVNEASGQVSLLDDPLAIAPLFWSKGLSWNTTDEAALKDAEQQVEQLAKHIKAFNSYPVQDVASGSVILAQCWNGNAKQAIDSSGNENLVFVYPEPISEMWLDSYHLPVGGKHPKAAHSWINFVLDPEVAAKEVTYTGFLSPVVAVESKLDPSIADNPLIFPPADAQKRGERTLRNETYDRRIAILTKFKAAAAQ